MQETFLAIINPAAGGGRCRQMVGAALTRLRAAGIVIETAETSAAGEATRIAREAYERGCRKFLAAGGDGTAFEIVNGLFPESRSPASGAGSQGILGGEAGQTPTLGFLPLGTGNSFLRDFSDRNAGDHGLEHALRAIEARRSRACDVFRLVHKDGVIHYINLLSVGFAADVAMLRHKQFLSQGQFGYF